MASVPIPVQIRKGGGFPPPPPSRSRLEKLPVSILRESREEEMKRVDLDPQIEQRAAEIVVLIFETWQTYKYYRLSSHSVRVRDQTFKTPVPMLESGAIRPAQHRV